MDDAGDVDGDGLTDLVVGAAFANGGRGMAAVYLGASAGPGSWDDAFFTVGDGHWLGTAVTGNIDSDGDGRTDFVVASDGNTLIFQNPSSGVAAAADADLRQEAFPQTPGGRDHDFDGDGHDDMLLSHGDSVWMAAGPFVSGVDPTTLFTLVAPIDVTSFSFGDIDGDDRLDLAAGSASHPTAAGRVAFFYGPLVGSMDFAVADAYLDGEHAELSLSAGLSIGGDLDGDGDDEIVVGVPGGGGGIRYTGAVVVFANSWLGTRTTLDADLILDGRGLGDRFGMSLATNGDVDGDGLDDLVVGAPGDQSSVGTVWIFPSANLVGSLP